MVKPKKHLGQHFLEDEGIAMKIAGLAAKDAEVLLEIGPGTGVLTKYLIESHEEKLYVVELDRESVAYLKEHYPSLATRIHECDFLKMNLSTLGNQVSIIGNFPYNISSQILFKVLEERERVPELVGMFQKEVAQRVASPPGSKAYGILSVLLQAYYDIEYCFTVPKEVFRPPPKVESGVIRLSRNTVRTLPCDEALFKKVIKTAFNQRRKTLRNSLSGMIFGKMLPDKFLKQRPEQLGVSEFIELTKFCEAAAQN